jgi:hypothetical protein
MCSAQAMACSDSGATGSRPAQPGHVGLGRGGVGQHGPGRDGQEGGRPRVLHRGDRVLLAGRVDHLHVLEGGLPGAAQRDRVGQAQRGSAGALGPGRELVRLGGEPGGLGPPGLLARGALVRDQVVVAGDPVHGGHERVHVEPAAVEAIGQVAC